MWHVRIGGDGAIDTEPRVAHFSLEAHECRRIGAQVLGSAWPRVVREGVAQLLEERRADVAVVTKQNVAEVLRNDQLHKGSLAVKRLQCDGTQRATERREHALPTPDSHGPSA